MSAAPTRRSVAVLLVALLTALVGPATAGAGVLSPWWSKPVRIDRAGGSASPDLAAVSCATVNLCVATDGLGNVLITTAPAAKADAWSTATVDSAGDANSVALGAVTCGAAVCLTADRGGHLVASTDPTGGAGAWTIASAPLVLDRNAQLSCPTSGLCVIVDGDNRILSSTDPTSLSAGWNVTLLGGPHVISAVSCPTNSFCVALDNAGNILTSSDPTGGASAWTVTPLPPARYNLWAISCPALTFCAAVDHDSDDVLTSNDPAGGSRAWRLARVMPSTRSSLLDISCATERLCVATDDAGNVHTSIGPTAGARAWRTSVIDGVPNSPRAGVLRGVSCPTPGLCVAVDQAGDAMTSTDPAGPAVAAAKPTVSKMSASLRGTEVKLAITLTAGAPPGAALTQFELFLPSGLTASRIASQLHRGIVVRGSSGHQLSTVNGSSSGVLIVRLKQAAPSARVTVSNPAILVGRTLARAYPRHRGKPLAIVLAATDSFAYTAKLRLALSG